MGKLVKLVKYIEDNLEYYVMKYGKINKPLDIINPSGLQYRLKSCMTEFVTLEMTNDINPNGLNEFVILHSAAPLFEKNDPEFANQIYEAMVKSFNIETQTLLEELR